MAYGGRAQAIKAIYEQDGNLTKAAIALGMSRVVLYRRIAEYGLRAYVEEARKLKKIREEAKERSLKWLVRHKPEIAREAVREIMIINRGIVPCVAKSLGVSVRTAYGWIRRLGLREDLASMYEASR